MHHCIGSTKHFHRSFTRGGAALPLEGGGVEDLHRREANWLIIGVTATNQVGAPFVLDKGMTRSWLRLIARGGRSSVGGGHGELRGGLLFCSCTQLDMGHGQYRIITARSTSLYFHLIGGGGGGGGGGLTHL